MSASDRRDAGNDLNVAGNGLIDEVELIGSVPDVGAGGSDRVGAGAVLSGTRNGRRTQIDLLLPAGSAPVEAGRQSR